MKSAIGITLIGGGVLLIYTGFKDRSIWAELLTVIRTPAKKP